MAAMRSRLIPPAPPASCQASKGAGDELAGGRERGIGGRCQSADSAVGGVQAIEPGNGGSGSQEAGGGGFADDPSFLFQARDFGFHQMIQGTHGVNVKLGGKGGVAKQQEPVVGGNSEIPLVVPFKL